MRVVVFGASGVQGRHQVHALARAGHSVVAVSRNPKQLLVDDKPVETFAADFCDRAAIEEVVQKADRIMLNLPSTSFNKSEPILAAAKSIGEAAKKAAVPLIIFNTSMPVPKEVQHITAQDDRRKMRESLRESVPTISIEPVVYLDNLLEGWALPPIRDQQKIVYCHKPDLRVSWICHHDVAQIMMAAMHRPDVAGRDIPVGGPETVVLSQLAEKLSKAWGKKLSHENQIVADFCDKISQTMKGRGLETDKVVSQMFKAYTYYNEARDEPFNIDMSSVVKELGIELTWIEEWAKKRSPWDDKGYY
ncbi:NmrA protein [Pyrenophora tritici-repentis]|uniref:NmrA protein n=1 Tax=Pyrenophora tritici-repentis TaxID=45151 RepID=A0A922SXJ9_9PLEO|nr:NmrA protein [Pyrenophora tritici-repentis]